MPVNVNWCLRQKKGIRLTEPSPRVAQEYIAKARSALGVAEMSLQSNSLDWAMIAAYYARYDAAYALLMHVGIKSEIHECTISLLREIFTVQGIVTLAHCEELERAKQARIDAQYYVKTPVMLSECQTALKEAREFVLAMEAALERLTQNIIDNIRQTLKK